MVVLKRPKPSASAVDATSVFTSMYNVAISLLNADNDHKVNSNS